jgi:sugar O-acyltransferase (sialic acid O-acetyltransferase NeuD family)
MPVARDTLQSQGVDASRLYFIDDAKAGSCVNGHQVVSFEQFVGFSALERHAVIAIADGKIRAHLAARFQDHSVFNWSIRASNVVIMDDVLVSEGAAISPFVTIASNVRIGRCFHANIYSYVEHDCVIGDFVTFAPSVMCNGNVVIEDYAYIGAGAAIRQGVSGDPVVIGKGAVVGMGAVVTKSVPAGVTVVGNPARALGRSL